MKNFFYTTIIITLFLTAPLTAQEKSNGEGTAAAGYAIDLLPSVLSAAQREAGYSLQVWAGYKNIKIRFVAAHLYQPENLINDSFKKYEMNVTAFILDYFFSDNFSGFWLGTGTELWNCEIEHKASGAKAAWTDNIITAGAGYVWKITENVYLDPFAAIHYRMNDNTVEAGGDKFSRQRVSASASVKIGYMFNI